eukprot:2517316-Amphidinium_carterae.2
MMIISASAASGWGVGRLPVPGRCPHHAAERMKAQGCIEFSISSKHSVVCKIDRDVVDVCTGDRTSNKYVKVASCH